MQMRGTDFSESRTLQVLKYASGSKSQDSLAKNAKEHFHPVSWIRGSTENTEIQIGLSMQDPRFLGTPFPGIMGLGSGSILEVMKFRLRIRDSGSGC